MKKIRLGIQLGVFLFSTAGIAGCGSLVSEDNVARAVEKQGYRDVHIVSKHVVLVGWNGCGNDDNAAFKATAINSVGQRVDLVACTAWPFKGVTVRTR